MIVEAVYSIGIIIAVFAVIAVVFFLGLQIWYKAGAAKNTFTNSFAGYDRPPNGVLSKLQDRRYEIGQELRTRVYFFKPKGYIACSIAEIAEYGDPTVLHENCSSEELGDAIFKHLLAYKTTRPEYPDTKLSSWSAFVASGAKSRQRFEENCWCLDIETQNSALRIDARPRKSITPHLSVSTTTRHDKKSVGDAAKACLDRVMFLRASGKL